MACQIIIVASETGQSIAKDCLNELINLTALRSDVYVNHLYAFSDSIANANCEPPSLDQINTILNGLLDQDNARSRVVAGNLFWVFIFSPDCVDNTGIYHSSPHFLESVGYIYSRYQTFLREKCFPRDKRFALFFPANKTTPNTQDRLSSRMEKMILFMYPHIVSQQQPVSTIRLILVCSCVIF